MKRLIDETGVDLLVAAGYIAYKDAFREGDGNYVGSFQKIVRDEGGIRYFINVYVTRIRAPKGIIYCYSADAQFTRGRDGEDEEVFDVQYFATDKTISTIEKFFEEIHNSMRLDHYERREAIAAV